MLLNPAQGDELRTASFVPHPFAGTRGAAPESDLRLVRVLLERGHVDAAHARSGQLRAAHPDHPHCAFLEGLCCEGAQVRHSQGAPNYMDHQVTQSLAVSHALCRHGCCFLSQDIPAAMGCYAAALAMDSRHEPALLRCAAISRASGHLEQAREWLLRAKVRDGPAELHDGIAASL